MEKIFGILAVTLAFFLIFLGIYLAVYFPEAMTEWETEYEDPLAIGVLACVNLSLGTIALINGMTLILSRPFVFSIKVVRNITCVSMILIGLLMISIALENLHLLPLTLLPFAIFAASYFLLGRLAPNKMSE